MKLPGMNGLSGQENLRRFFFQAEDGIRVKLVTGVQTCALPIFRGAGAVGAPPRRMPPLPRSARRAEGARGRPAVGRAVGGGRGAEPGSRRAGLDQLS